MTYLEVAVSDGPGTLIKHAVIELAHPLVTGDHLVIFTDMVWKTLTKKQAQEFHAIHNGWIAV